MGKSKRKSSKPPKGAKAKAAPGGKRGGGAKADAAPSRGKSAKGSGGPTGTPPGGKPPYAMPCPQCRELIDARLKHCPHCGVDTDRKLMPARIIFMFVSIALVLGILALIKRCAGD